MDEINSNIGSFKNNQDKLQNQAQSVNIDTESINSVFVTCKKEDKRTTFAGTFKEVDFEYAPTKQGQEFLEGLKKNKESLMADLGLGEEEYDALSCVALALASQETGMGLERGLGIIENIEEFYDTLADKDKETFRTTLANWVLSYDGSVNTKEYKKEHPNNKDKSFFEDVNLDKLNKMLKKTDIKLEQGDLDYIRYALTDESQALNIVEFSAYAWNKGINSSSMKADRLVANKIKTIFMLPENFGESQFSVNIAYLTNKYAQNANADFSDVEYLLNEYSKK